MADCVDREKLIHDIVNIPSKVCEEQHQPLLLTGAAFRQKEILGLIEGATLVHAEPVVHADWIANPSAELYTCPVCWKDAYEETKYCPNCGAKMYSDEVCDDCFICEFFADNCDGEDECTGMPEKCHEFIECKRRKAE